LQPRKRFSEGETRKKLKSFCRCCRKYVQHQSDNCYFKPKEEKIDVNAYLTIEDMDIDEKPAEHSSNKKGEIVWYIDSGSTSHMTNNPDIMKNIREANRDIYLGNNKSIKAVRMGTVNVANKDKSH